MSGSAEYGYEVPFFRDYLRLVLDGVPVDQAMNDYVIEKARLEASVTKSSNDAADALDALRCEPPSDGEP